MGNSTWAQDEMYRLVGAWLLIPIAIASCSGDSTSADAERASAVLLMAHEIRDQVAGPDSISETKHAVRHAVNSHLGILFIHVDWAPMTEQRGRFCDFALDFTRQFGDRDVQFHYVDCTPMTSDYQSLREIDGWRELEPVHKGRRTSLIHGNGEIAWLRNGRVVDVKPIRFFPTNGQLIQHTNQLFQDSDDAS